MKPSRELERMLADSDDAFDKSLFEAARGEAPSPGLEQKILESLQAGPTLRASIPVKTGTEGAAATKAGVPLLVKAGAGVGLAALAVVAIATLGRPAAPPAPAPETVAASASANVSAPATATAAAADGVASAGNPSASLEASPRPSTSTTSRGGDEPAASASGESRAVAKSAPKSPIVAAPSSTASGSSDLAGEVAALDRARASLKGGSPAKALAELDAYQKAYPRGLLAQEATMLRIEVLMEAGRTSEARALGHAFIAANPSTPHRKHIQTLLKEAE